MVTRNQAARRNARRCGGIAGTPPISVYTFSPGITLGGLDGKTYNLDAFRGKVVLLNFWATWCPPCRREMPDMEKLYQRLSQKGLVVLAVSDEKRETVEDFLKKQNYTFPVLLDPDRKVNSAFGIEGIPNSFLFDRQGKLLQVRPRGATARSSSFGVGRVPHAP